VSHILCIETTTKNCSVALFQSGKLLSFNEECGEGYVHSEKLSIFITETLKSAGSSFSELNAIAVSSGPGSYTGLRIGVSMAKGICFSQSIPLLAFSNLTQLAHAAKQKYGAADYYIPMIDARRMEVYTQKFNSELVSLTEPEALVVENTSFSDLSGKRVVIIGDGAEKTKEVLRLDNVFISELECSAKNMGTIAQQKFLNNEIENLAYFEPFYLKDFIAGKPKKLL